MALFQRVTTVLSANLNDLVGRMENPETMLRHSVRQLEEAVETAMDRAVSVVAREKLLSRDVEQHRRSAGVAQTRAAQAVKAGDDAGARQALRRKVELERSAAALDEQRAEAAEVGAAMRQDICVLQSRLAEARTTMSLLLARRDVSLARKAVACCPPAAACEPLVGFNRWAERVEVEAAEAEAWAELRGDSTTLSDRFDGIEAQVESELLELKRGTNP